MENQVIPIVRPQQQDQQRIQVPLAVQAQLNKTVAQGIPIDIPSKGFFYPETNPLSEGVVEIVKMTAKHEDILSNSQLIKKGVVLNELLKAVIKSPINCLDDILMGDKNAIFFKIRENAYGKNYSTRMKCPDCGADNKVDIDLSILKNKEYDFSNSTKGVNRFEYTLPISGKRLSFKLLNHKDESAIDAELKSLEKFGGSAEVTTRFKYIILSIDGNEDRNLIKNFVDSMTSEDSLAFKKVTRAAMPDYDSNFDFACCKCDFAGRISIPISISFMWPNPDE